MFAFTFSGKQQVSPIHVTEMSDLGFAFILFLVQWELRNTCDTTQGEIFLSF